jgi:type IV secretory pathway VirB3-like protein
VGGIFFEFCCFFFFFRFVSFVAIKSCLLNVIVVKMNLINANLIEYDECELNVWVFISSPRRGGAVKIYN